MQLNFLLQPVCQGFPRRFKIIPSLEVHPELRFHSEKASHPQGSVCRDASLPVDDLVDAARRDAHGLGQVILAHLHRLEEILKQDFARVDWGGNRVPP